MRKYIVILFSTILLVFFFSCEESASINTSVKGEGVVHVFPEGKEFAKGAEVVLEAIPGDYNNFAGWTGDVESQQNPVSLKLSSSKSVTALFPLLEGSDREVFVYKQSERSLNVGDNCEFIIDLDLPTEQEYRVWIYPDSSTISSASSSVYSSSPVLTHDEKDIMRYGYLVDGSDDSAEPTSGSCTHWYVDIDTSEGSADNDYVRYRFEYPVTWE